MEGLVFSLIALFLFITVASTMDANSAKPTAIKHCVVSEKTYVAGHVAYDSDHNPIYYADKWTILVSPLFENVEVTKEQYEHLHKGMAVNVLVRKGNVVGGEYYSIAPSLEAQQQ